MYFQLFKNTDIYEISKCKEKIQTRRTKIPSLLVNQMADL